jgi:hypothetical protein
MNHESKVKELYELHRQIYNSVIDLAKSSDNASPRELLREAIKKYIPQHADSDIMTIGCLVADAALPELDRKHRCKYCILKLNLFNDPIRLHGNHDKNNCRNRFSLWERFIRSKTKEALISNAKKIRDLGYYINDWNIGTGIMRPISNRYKHGVNVVHKTLKGE